MIEPSGEFGQAEGTNFAEIIAGEFRGNLAAVDEFDLSHEELYQQLENITDALSEDPDNLVGLEVDFDLQNNYFKGLVTSIARHSRNADLTRNLAVEIIHSDSLARSARMNEILDGSYIGSFDADAIEVALKKVTKQRGTYEGNLHRIANVYTDDLRADIMCFMQVLFMKHGKTFNVGEHSNISDESTTLEIKKKPLEHVGDVAKIAAGVTIALAIDRLLRRKR